MPAQDEPEFGIENPLDPTAGGPKPWHKPQQENRHESGSPGSVDGSGTGDAIDAGAEGAGLAADIVSGAGDLAAGAVEGAGEVAGAALEGAGELLGGCAEGCSGCSLAVLFLLFAGAGSAMALFR